MQDILFTKIKLILLSPAIRGTYYKKSCTFSYLFNTFRNCILKDWNKFTFGLVLRKLMFYYHFLSVIVQFMPVFVHFVHFLNWKMKWYYGFEFGKPIYSNEKENIM